MLQRKFFAYICVHQISRSICPYLVIAHSWLLLCLKCLDNWSFTVYNIPVVVNIVIIAFHSTGIWDSTCQGSLTLAVSVAYIHHHIHLLWWQAEHFPDRCKWHQQVPTSDFLQGQELFLDKWQPPHLKHQNGDVFMLRFEGTVFSKMYAGNFFDIMVTVTYSSFREKFLC